MSGRFAVFEIKGEEVEQITVWLEDLDQALEYLHDWRKRFNFRHYMVFEEHEGIGRML